MTHFHTSWPTTNLHLPEIPQIKTTMSCCFFPAVEGKAAPCTRHTTHQSISKACLQLVMLKFQIFPSGTGQKKQLPMENEAILFLTKINFYME